MSLNVKTLLNKAGNNVQSISVSKANDLRIKKQAIFIDVREEFELKTDGKIPSSIHIPRGMLEFCLDPATPYYNSIFSKDQQFVFYCKSGARSKLSVYVAQKFGLKNVVNMDGGILGWRENYLVENN